MTARVSVYGRFFLVLGSVVIIVGSCGGRTLSETTRVQGDGGDTSTGQGGSGPSSGPGSSSTSTGPSGTGGGAGSGGPSGSSTGSGGSQTAGRGGAGGSCFNVGCPDIACGPGYQFVLKPGACCPVCEPIQCNVACTMVPCPSGSHLEKDPNECCPKCVPDPTDTCKKGQQAYAELRQALIEKYNSMGCRLSRECTLVYESNRCGATCGTAFPVSLADSAQQNLRASAESNCATCPVMSTPPCVPLSAYCTPMGRCSTIAGPPPP
jgi:hypothetical protein